jgi:hypothetical protein
MIGQTEIVEHGIEKNYQFLVEIDHLPFVAKIHVVRPVVFEHRLHLANGLVPMYFVVTARLDE